MHMPDLSVVIPTLNNRATLHRTLLTLFDQSLPHDRYEIVVLDDGSSDGTDEMVRTLPSPVSVRYHWQENRGRAAARNAGSRLARGRILLYLDSDIFATPNLLERHYQFYERYPSAIGVQGRTMVHPDSKITPFMKTKELFPDLTHRNPTNLSPYSFITRNVSIRAEDLWAVGGFDESFNVGGPDLVDSGDGVVIHSNPTQ